MMMKFAAGVAMAAGLVACGGDFCGSDVSSLSGTWEVSITADNDTVSGKVVIDDAGNVSLTTSEGDGWDCDLVDDQLCALKVHCSQGNDDFTLSLTKK